MNFNQEIAKVEKEMEPIIPISDQWKFLHTKLQTLIRDRDEVIKAIEKTFNKLTLIITQEDMLYFQEKYSELKKELGVTK